MNPGLPQQAKLQARRMIAEAVATTGLTIEEGITLVGGSPRDVKRVRAPTSTSKRRQKRKRGRKR